MRPVKMSTFTGAVSGPSAGMATKLETRVGEEYITPSFQKHLEEFYNLAGPADQARCLELVSTVRLGEDLRSQYDQPPRYTSKIPKDIRRCQSAMAKIGGPDPHQDFRTTYGREYAPKLAPPSTADRPCTSRGYATTKDSSGPLGISTYSDEYHNKLICPVGPIRSGTSSGERNNKPHPKQAFMVWRFPSNGRRRYVPPVPVVEAMTKEKMDQMHKRLFTSTYQNDYLGIPQGFQMKSAFDLPPDWKSNVPFSLETNHRIAYQSPVQQPQLKLPSTRYGANVKKHLPAVGSIPTINRYLLDLKNKTTYDRHFNSNATAVTQQIKDVARDINVDALRKYYNQASGEERVIVGKMLESLKPDNMPGPPSSNRIGRTWRPTPPRTPLRANETLQCNQIDESQFPLPSALVNT